MKIPGTHIQQCASGDLDLLQAISRETFYETFAGMNTPANMKSYVAQAFGTTQLIRELADRNSGFYFIKTEGGEAAGYMKLNFHEAQTEIRDPHSMEVERIYVRKKYQGKGLGHKLLEYAFLIARERDMAYLWLGVWEHNTTAIAFYENHGFIKSGTHAFRLGNEDQTDIMMKLEIRNRE